MYRKIGILYLLFTSIMALLILLSSAPVNYNYNFCILCFGIYLINSLFFITDVYKKQGILNFHIPFCFSFFLMNILYPVFVFPIDPEYFAFFAFGFNYGIVCKALCVAEIGILSYYLVYFLSSQKKPGNSLQEIRINNMDVNLTLLLTVIFFILFILVRGINTFFMGYGDSIEDLENNSGLISPLLSVFTCLLFILISLKVVDFQREYHSVYNFITNNKLTITIFSVLIFLYLIGGSRTLVIKLLLSAICLYSLFIKRISGKLIIFGGIIAFLSLGILSRTRVADSNSGRADIAQDFIQNSSLLDFAMDFVIINRNLYLAIDEVEKNGYSLGLKSSKSFFSFFPYYPALVSHFGLQQADINSEVFFSETTGVGFSVGDNMVGDLYMAGGVISVILGMCFLAGMICLIEKNINKNIYWLYSYTIFLSLSVIYTRFSIFYFSRVLIWGLILIKIILDSSLIFKMVLNKKEKHSNI